MLRRVVLLAVACCCLMVTGCAGQNASSETGLNPNSAPQSDETGPHDPAQLVAPGPVDENVSAEFTETASGLRYRILRASDQRKPTAASEVVVHYKGWLDNNRIFDSSYQRGETISFPLQGVIPGWTEGLQLVGEGGMIELEIPSNLGYGDQGAGEIPPGARLHFLVELMAIR
jgi:FKBP-type peptidyl-prolyl cis-trans isomerase FkpA